MRLNEIEYNDSQPVDGYGPGFFRIGGDLFDGPVITGPTGTRTWAGLEDVDALLLFKDLIDVLFVGTGAQVSHLPDALLDPLQSAGIGVEAMSSPAACRTYNVLLSEGRRVALALLPV
ncbi:Mth938-like domain-containing protein [Sulfitobacter sp. F26204]|uniref:Mth938-like domain-containing protein n=1 Tax=Sulfitobacter sp. F26204 TaxID=2996014 RepID=UPI00225E4BF9|nr:Mth938-like domain-containing protein [Sulfitobacter sp. F26204]MCX7560789.1 Mth938-like domain-containing protein [Sulfitobacter sp. F26204]